MGKKKHRHAPSREEVTRVATKYGVSRTEANRAIRRARSEAERQTVAA